MDSNWKETRKQRVEKEIRLLFVLGLGEIDKLIANVLNYFWRASKVCMQFLSGDNYQLNNTVPRLEREVRP